MDNVGKISSTGSRVESGSVVWREETHLEGSKFKTWSVSKLVARWPFDKRVTKYKGQSAGQKGAHRILEGERLTDSATYAGECDYGDKYPALRQKLTGYSPCPFSKVRLKSTLTRSNVWPCDLCTLNAHAKMSGTWKGIDHREVMRTIMSVFYERRADTDETTTCSLPASVPPITLFTVNSAGIHKHSIPFVNRTTGHRAELCLMTLGTSFCDPCSSSPERIAWWVDMPSLYDLKSTTLPTEPLTRTPWRMFY